MEILNRCCAGLDVHKKTVVACVRTVGPDGKAETQTRTFGTMTAELLELADWLEGRGVRQVAMESTGVYWKPVFHLLEGRFEAMVVNARHIKNVPGRKTDVQDAGWIAELLQHGLLRPSFLPPPPIRELRDLTRQRAQLVRDRATVVNRVQKVLEDANIKLAGVASNIMGVSGRDILAALLAGSTDAEAMAELARGKLRRKREALAAALRGRMSDYHRLLIALHLEHVDLLDEQIAQLSAEIAARLCPCEETLVRLETIPGVGRRTAEILAAEIGLDMSRFPSAAHLASWAGMCPGNYESAGKRKNGPMRLGNRALRRALVEAAHAAARTKKADQGYSAWALSSADCALRGEESGGGGRSHHPAYRLPRAQRAGSLPRAGDHRARRTPSRTDTTPGGRATDGARLCGDDHADGACCLTEESIFRRGSHDSARILSIGRLCWQFVQHNGPFV
jgi:transposase